MERPMSSGKKIDFDPKVNFELPGEIGPLLAQTASVSIAETEDAWYQSTTAARDTIAGFEKQLALAQADAREVAGKLWSLASRNIDAAFGCALGLARANTVQECVAIQADFIRSQSANLIRQTEDLGRSLGKFAADS